MDGSRAVDEIPGEVLRITGLTKVPLNIKYRCLEIETAVGCLCCSFLFTEMLILVVIVRVLYA